MRTIKDIVSLFIIFGFEGHFLPRLKLICIRIFEWQLLVIVKNIYIYKQFSMYWNLPHVTLSPLKSELWETVEGRGKLLTWVLLSGEMTLAAPGIPSLRQNAQFYMSMQGSSLVLFIYSLFFCNFFWSKHSKVFNVCFLYAFWHDMVASLVAQTVKRLPAMQETWVQSLGQKDPLEKEMAPHSSTLAWKIPRTEEPGRLQSMGSQRVGHDWAISLSFFTWYVLFVGKSLTYVSLFKCYCYLSHLVSYAWIAILEGMGNPVALQWTFITFLMKYPPHATLIRKEAVR